MRKKSIIHLYLAWFMLLGMLVHVLVEHQDGTFDLFLRSQTDVQRVGENSPSFYEAHSVAHDPVHGEMEHPHEQGEIEHPEWYLCPSSFAFNDLISLRLLSASLPVWGEPLQPQAAPVFARTETETRPPPEQLRLALTTTVLLI